MISLRKMCQLILTISVYLSYTTFLFSFFSGGLGAVSPQRTKPQENLRLLIGTLAHKVPACYTVGHAPQGRKKSGCRIPGFWRISAPSDTESHSLALWGISSFEPNWLSFFSKIAVLSHKSRFWLNRTFQDHQEHSFHFRLVLLR